MKYTFHVNGNIKVTLEPDSSLERELFKELFSGDVSVEPEINTAPNGKIVITKVDKTIKPAGNA